MIFGYNISRRAEVLSYFLCPFLSSDHYVHSGKIHYAAAYKIIFRRIFA